RKLDNDLRALRRSALDPEFSSQILGAFAHADQTEPPIDILPRVDCFEIESFSIVLDHERHRAVLLPEPHCSSRRAGMLGDVRKRLLHHPIERNLDMGIMAGRGLRGWFKVDFDQLHSLEFLAEKLKSDDQS